MFPKPPFHPGADRMKVELDKKSLFALASDTRLEILHSLQPMRRTVSQLAESMNIDKAAVFRHLKKMEEGGLVKRFEDHGFVYYGLSWKARDLLSPNENTRIIILLSSSWVILIAVVLLLSFSYIGMTHAQTGSPSGDPRFDPKINWGYSSQGNSTSEKILGVPFDWDHLLSVVVPFLIVPVVLALWATRLMRRPRQPLHAGLENKPTEAREPRHDLDD
jgi:DNA-binding transcriptional ArsR family regulator